MTKYFLRFLATAVYFTSIYSYAFYPTYVSDTKHLTEIKEIYSGKSIVLESDYVGQPIHSKVKAILLGINKNLNEQLTTLAKDGMAGSNILTFRSLQRSSINGEITTKIITENNGVLRVEVGGFSIAAEVKFDVSRFTLYGDIKTSPLKFSADYDVVSGKVYNLQEISATRVYVDVDGNGIFNNIVAEVTDEVLDIFLPKLIRKSINDALDNTYYIGGLNDVIPIGEWVINGVDVGQQIKNLITGVSAGKYVSISISESNQRYYYGGGAFRNYYKNKLFFDVSNNYLVAYENEPVFSTGNWINPCYVGGASSGCYEP